MSALIIDGKRIAADIETVVAHDITRLQENGRRAPSLHAILCGEDPASAVYVNSKAKACARVGIDSVVHTPPETTTTEELVRFLAQLNADDTVDAILVQLPLYPHIDAARILEAVDPGKDVDGFHPANFGLLAEGTPRIAPCTPMGCMELLRRSNIAVAGAHAVVVGRSTIVGRPMALLLINAHATVTVCHSKTADLPSVCKQADILVAATGRPRMIDASYVKPGACVIDVGITRIEGKLVGDVDRATVEPVAGWLTPVPGGVGPMTIAMLLRNTLTLATSQRTLI